MSAGCLRMIKMDMFALNNLKCILVSNEKDRTLSIYAIDPIFNKD